MFLIMKEYVFISSNTSNTMLLGSVLASDCVKGCIIYLYGCVGVGKSVFCVGFLKKLGYIGYINSPTYTLVESYFLNDWHVHHFDCYRLNSSEELENIGFRDFFDKKAVCLIEWPKKYIKILPVEDISITISYYSTNVNSRKIIIQFVSDLGKKMLGAILLHWNLFK